MSSNPGSNIRLGFKSTADLIGELPQHHQDAYRNNQSLQSPLKPVPENWRKDIQSKILRMERPLNDLYNLLAYLKKHGSDVEEAFKEVQIIDEALIAMSHSLSIELDPE